MVTVGSTTGETSGEMNAILQSQFQRVEAALNTLIDSIAAYTPSPSAAVALIEADDELSKGLERRKWAGRAESPARVSLSKHTTPTHTKHIRFLLLTGKHR